MCVGKRVDIEKRKDGYGVKEWNGMEWNGLLND